MTTLHVLIIASKDGPHFEYQTASNFSKMLRENLDGHPVEVTLINKLSSVLDDLHVVATHKAVTTPTIIVLDGNKTIFRKSGGSPPPLNEFVEFIISTCRS